MMIDLDPIMGIMGLDPIMGLYCKGLEMTEDEVIPRKNSHANRIVNLTGIIMQLTGVSKWGV